MSLEIEVTAPGLTSETLPSGRIRYRVRPEGDSRAKITLSVGPDHPEFISQYHLARRGVKPENPSRQSRLGNSGSIDREISICLRKAAGRAKASGHDFELTKRWVWGLLERQRYTCALSGMEFDFSPGDGDRRRARAISIDRVDTGQGYTTSNVRLVTVMANIARSDWPDEEFIAMCRAVAENKK